MAENDADPPGPYGFSGVLIHIVEMAPVTYANQVK